MPARAHRRFTGPVTVLHERRLLEPEHGDLATASLIENWIDKAERRTWFLFEAGRH